MDHEFFKANAYKYLSGELLDNESLDFEKHMILCNNCRHWLVEQRTILAGLKKQILTGDLYELKDLFREIYEINSIRSQKLLIFSKYTTDDYEIPKIVSSVGLAACAASVIDMPIISESDRYELLLLTAFYFPSLSDSDRLNIFKRVEGFILDQDIVTLPANSALRLFLMTGDPGVFLEMQKAFLDKWIDNLLKAADEIKTRIPDVNVNINAAMSSLLSKPLENINNIEIEPDLGWRESIPITEIGFANIGYLRPHRGPAHGTANYYQIKIRFHLAKPAIVYVLSQDSIGKMYILLEEILQPGTYERPKTYYGTLDKKELGYLIIEEHIYKNLNSHIDELNQKQGFKTLTEIEKYFLNSFIHLFKFVDED